MLSQRLRKIANEIQLGETMADIGTDHGFLPIALWEEGICPKVLMTDISVGSLEKAKALSRGKVNPDWCRLGYGLEPISAGEVDVIVLAGMGGILMTEILKKDLKKSLTFNKLILQPRSKAGYLRKWLYNNGFNIIRETLAEERGKIWEIITATPYEDVQMELPFTLATYPNELTATFLNMKEQKAIDILAAIDNSSNSATPRARVEGELRQITRLKNMMKGVRR